MRLVTYGNTAVNLVDNELGSTGSRYSSTNFQSRKGMSYSSYVPHNCTDAYKAKYTLPPRKDVMEFYVQTNTK